MQNIIGCVPAHYYDDKYVYSHKNEKHSHDLHTI